ncbi:MAG: HupE/UreJ family protein [Casimicrobiaceae bacterium]
MAVLRTCLVLLLALSAGVAHAHKASDAYLTLERDGTHLTGRWDIALRDLDAALGLDLDGNGEITWGELRTRSPAIATYALQHLVLRSGGEACPVTVRDHLVDQHTDGAYTVLLLDAACPVAGPTVNVRYTLFFDVDPQHRGLLQVVENGISRSVIFAADHPQEVVGGDAGGALDQFIAYVREGVWHIWTGFDHILFLLSLLLPAVLVRRDAAWQPAASFRPAFLEVAKVVTAFTVAHSITLTVAALGIVSLPSRWVESAIALSVVLAALNNIRPVIAEARWIAAFAFGLVHGFGFAGALQDLGLPSGALALSLAGFNIGVELGQLVIVAVFLPLAYRVRSTLLYRRVALVGGSAAIAAVAAVWLAERALDMPLFSALAAS